MSWKQPIPIDFDADFGSDYISRDLYLWLLMKSANRDGFFTDEKTKRTFAIKRGQVVFGRNKWAEIIRTSPATVERALHKLSEIYQKVSYSAYQGFTVVSIKNYDEITDMSDSRASGERVVSTSKSVKSVKKRNIKEKKNPINTKLESEFGEVVQFMASTLENISEDYKPSPSLLKNFGEVRVNHSMEEIKMAITKASRDQFWSKHCFPHVLFRTKGKEGMEVDNILTLLNLDSGPEPEKLQKNDVNNYL
jgi:uncharacterized protein YqgV (UPF0045/DUF77 family)